MKQVYIINENHPQLLLFFAGWAADETPFKQYRPKDMDYMICYDYRTLEHDYLKTRELSLPNVFDPYAAQFSTDKNSLDKLLGDSKKIVVEVHTVVPNGNGIATVRFGKKLVDTQTNAVDSSQNWTATIAYEYIPNFKADEPSRLINPFGFKVTSYRMDPDLTVGAAK